MAPGWQSSVLCPFVPPTGTHRPLIYSAVSKLRIGRLWLDTGGRAAFILPPDAFSDKGVRGSYLSC
jgi:hypothetical protein